MKKTLLLSAAMMTGLALASCSSNNMMTGTCHIHGTMTNQRYEGKKIFLVPMDGPQDAAHVDSVVIKDGKFEFEKDTAQLEAIRIDYHYREGAEELLVVTEPGDVNVKIGPTSSCGGTPQNDSLQVWKDMTQKLNREVAPIWAEMQHSAQFGDSANYKTLNSHVSEMRARYIKRSRQMEEGLKKGPLHDFLEGMFPSHAKK